MEQVPIPFPSGRQRRYRPPERKGRDAMSVSEMESYRDLILENIEYDYLCREFSTYREDLDEIVELMVETVCAKRKTTRIAGSDFPHEVVRSRFLKLDSAHIRVCHGRYAEQHHGGPQHEAVFACGAVQRAHHDQQSLHRTSQPRYVRRRLVNSRFSAARQHREKGFCHETTSCLHYGSLEQQPV